jgi:cell division septation protein DedD
VNETTHDGADEGFHEIHLSGKQLVFLFMFTTAVSVLIFLCGVLVGRGVRLERGEAADPATVAASTPAAAPSDTAASIGPPAAEPPAPAEGELSYKKRLEGERPPAEQLKPQAPPAAAPPVQAVAPPKPEPQPQPTSGARPGTWVVQVIATREKPTASTLVTRLTQKGYPAFLVTPAAGAPPMFKVQVGRFSDRREAEEVARRLEKEEQFKPWISR